MSTIALLNVYSYVDGHDFTGDTNQASLTMEAVALNRSTFRSGGWTQLKGGLKSSTFDMGGFWASAAEDAVDPEAFSSLGARNKVHTFGPAETVGETAYLWRAGKFSYQLLGSIGELAPFTLNAQGTDSVGVVRGALAADMQDVSAIGPLGGGVQLGAGAAGKHLYATLHAFAAATTITVAVESSPDNTFAVPTTVATFDPVTARGASWLPRVPADAIADTWFRLNVTAITGTFTVAGALAIQ